MLVLSSLSDFVFISKFIYSLLYSFSPVCDVGRWINITFESVVWVWIFRHHSEVQMYCCRIACSSYHSNLLHCTYFISNFDMNFREVCVIGHKTIVVLYFYVLTPSTIRSSKNNRSVVC